MQAPIKTKSSQYFFTEEEPNKFADSCQISAAFWKAHYDTTPKTRVMSKNIERKMQKEA
jgi:hypothetical protein